MKMGRMLLKSFVSDDRGTTAMEYALIATVIAMALFIAFGFVGTGAGNLFNSVSNATSNSLNNSSGLLN